MSDKFESHTDEVPVHTTKNGSSYVKPFDVIRSKRGREVIDAHAKLEHESPELSLLRSQLSEAVKERDSPQTPATGQSPEHGQGENESNRPK